MKRATSTSHVQLYICLPGSVTKPSPVPGERKAGLASSVLHVCRENSAPAARMCLDGGTVAMNSKPIHFLSFSIIKYVSKKQCY